jgi:hypothetical protein
MNLHHTDLGDGHTEIRRHPDEEPFALLTAPRARPDRRWGITYRSHGQTDWTAYSNVSTENRAKAIAELERTVRYANDYQLGLTDQLPA